MLLNKLTPKNMILIGVDLNRQMRVHLENFTENTFDSSMASDWQQIGWVVNGLTGTSDSKTVTFFSNSFYLCFIYLIKPSKGICLFDIKRLYRGMELSSHYVFVPTHHKDKSFMLKLNFIYFENFQGTFLTLKTNLIKYTTEAVTPCTYGTSLLL